MTTSGNEVLSCPAGECELLVPYKPKNDRPGGVINGMTIMGAADVAMWLAILKLKGVDEQWVTSDLKTAFLKGGSKEALTCRARVIKIGRRTAYGTVDTFGERSGLLAHHVLSFAKTSVRTSAEPPTDGTSH